MPKNDAIPPETLVLALQLAEDIDRWDGAPEEASRLRSAVRGITDLGAAAKDPRLGALAMVRNAYARKQPLSLERLSKDEALARRMAPFLGDPDMGTWAFHRPYRIPDREAARWLDLLAPHALVDEPVRQFVEVMFGCRKRSLWVPASRAIAQMALRDQTLRDALAKAWSEVFPAGVPKAWPQPADFVRPQAPSRLILQLGKPAHAMRHVFHSACAWAAANSDPKTLPGFTAEAVARISLPRSASDASVLLLALRELLASPQTRESVIALLPARVREAPADPQCDDALRGFLSIPDSTAEDVRQAARHTLVAPRWLESAGVKEKTDALRSFVATAQWFKSREDEAACAQMLTNAGAARPALLLALEGILPDGHTRPLHAALPRLQLVFDRYARETERTEATAVALVELLLLLEHSDMAALPWASVLSRAVPGRDARVSGTVAEAARAEVLLMLVGESARDDFSPPACLIRDHDLPTGVALALAPSQNRFVATQVAIAIERSLREAESDAAQVRLLWELLQRNPLTYSFEELHDVLRGVAGPLHDFVRSLVELDRARDEDQKPEGLVGKAIIAYQAGLALLEASPKPHSADCDAARSAIAELLVALETVTRLLGRPSTDTGGIEWRQEYKATLFGADDRAGLAAWMRWLGLQDEGLRDAWSTFDQTLKNAHDAEPAASIALCGELDTAGTALAERLEGLAWPERTMTAQVVGATRAFITSRRILAWASAAESERVASLLGRGDEKSVIAYLKPPDRLAYLPATDIQRMAAFLLGRFRFGDHKTLRQKVKGRVQLRAWQWHWLPLTAGIAAGPFFVLDFGEEFVRQPAGPALYCTLAGTLLLSFVLLSSSLASQSDASSAGSRLKAVWNVLARVLPTVVARVLPLFLVAAALACLSSVAVMSATGRIAGEHLVLRLALWTGLSLFLGMFIGLVLQGRGFSQKHDAS